MSFPGKILENMTEAITTHTHTHSQYIFKLHYILLFCSQSLPPTRMGKRGYYQSDYIRVRIITFLQQYAILCTYHARYNYY